MFEDCSVVLASASPRRVELLKKIGISDFEICPSNVPEADSPVENAVNKALSVSVKYPHAYVIGADTVIRFRGETIGKPRNLADAERILTMLSGEMHEVVTGVSIYRRDKGANVCFRVATQVFFRPLSPECIASYLKLVNVLDKAGAYAIQEHGDMIIDHIEGDYDNVIGLPTEAVAKALASLIAR